METLLSFLLGGASSYVASQMYRKYSSSKKPEIKISDVMIETSNTFKHADVQGYLVKVVNMTPRELLDVKIELNGVKALSDSGSMVSSFVVCSKEYYYWEKHNPDPNVSDYAWRVFLPMHEGYDYKTLFEECDFLQLTVTAKDSFYDSYAVAHRIYEKKDIRPSSCRFMFKDDMDCVKDPELEKIAKFEAEELAKKS